MKHQLLAMGLVAALAGPQVQAASTGQTDTLTGDVILVMKNFANTESLFWDLSFGSSDLTAIDFFTNPGLKFTISDAAVDAWVAANIAGGALTFNIFGLSEIGGGGGFPPPPAPNIGGVVSVANLALQANGSQVGLQVDSLQQFINGLNTAGLPDNGVLITNDPVGNAFFGNNFHNANLFGSAASGTVNGSPLDFYYIQKDPTVASTALQNGAAPFATELAGDFSFTFDGGVANLSYAPVPVPAAVWLLGSALFGLSRARRRA